MTKEYIENNLLNKNKGLDSNKRAQTNLSAEELYLIYHDIEVPLCGCGQKRKFHNFAKGYKEYCGMKCSFSLEKRLIKVQETFMKNYGVLNTMQSK